MTWRLSSRTRDHVIENTKARDPGPPVGEQESPRKVVQTLGTGTAEGFWFSFRPGNVPSRARGFRAEHEVQRYGPAEKRAGRAPVRLHETSAEPVQSCAP